MHENVQSQAVWWYQMRRETQILIGVLKKQKSDYGDRNVRYLNGFQSTLTYIISFDSKNSSGKADIIVEIAFCAETRF